MEKITVLLFPWLGHGHVSPHLELGKKLTKRNFKVYLCSTPANLSSIKNKIGEKYSTSIQLVELHLPKLLELPPKYHTTNGLPPHLMPTLKVAFEKSSPDFSLILEKLRPDLLIYDCLQPWAPEAAAKLGIPACMFMPCSTAMTALMIHVINDRGKSKFPFSSIYFHDYEIAILNQLIDSANGKDKDLSCVNESIRRSCDIILVKSFKEIEGKFIDYISTSTGKKVVPIGPVVQDAVNETNKECSDIIEWLGKKPKNSTVFVSFGSEYFLSNEDMVEIARGLELSGVNFIWVVRFPLDNKGGLEEALPEGFLERVGQRGLVVEDWAPQAQILVHSSTGGFVCHCGWSSVIECMKFGVPIIAMPMHLDQPINARLLSEIGNGVEIVRNGNGKLEKETIAAVIKQVMLEETGKAVRDKAKDMSEAIELKGEEEIDQLVGELAKLLATTTRTNHMTCGF